MQLHHNNIVPQHLAHKASSSSLWGKPIMFAEKSCVFVQAPSGAGKTTLVHLLYGLRSDYSGSIQWGNINPANANDATLSALRANELSIVFQDMRLFPQLTAWENIMVKAQLTNTTGEQQVAEWMEHLGILHKKDALASTMSYGEQQRTAIIRALVQPFKWLLLDEPFSHLDSANRHKAIQLITDVTTQRRAAILFADLDDNNYFPYSHKLTL